MATKGTSSVSGFARSTFSICDGEGTACDVVPSPRLRGEGAPQDLIWGADEVPLATSDVPAQFPPPRNKP